VRRRPLPFESAILWPVSRVLRVKLGRSLLSTPVNNNRCLLGHATLLLLAAFATAPARAQEKIDLKLVSRSQAESEILWRHGFTLEEPALQAELQALLDSLTVSQTIDPAIRLRVHIFNSPDINAFAMPDGSIYIFAGLLARLNSVDELAFVVGHEATHAIAWHAQRNIAQAKSKSALFQVLSLTTSIAIGSSGWSGAGLIDSFSQLGLTLVAAASITGYSRALESEADMGGYRMLQAKGASSCASVGALRAILAESPDHGSVATFFWGSHPRTVDRIKAIEGAIGSTCVADTSLNDSYGHIKYPMLKLRARMWNRADRPELAVRCANPYVAAYPDDPEIHCIFGDALATSENADTLALARSAYSKAIQLGGATYREPLLGLATMAEAQHDTLATVNYLERYLAGDAEVPKRRSTKRHVEELKQAFHWAARAPMDSTGSNETSTPKKEED